MSLEEELDINIVENLKETIKNQKVEEKVNKEDFNFEGARLLEVDFSGI